MKAGIGFWSRAAVLVLGTLTAAALSVGAAGTAEPEAAGAPHEVHIIHRTIGSHGAEPGNDVLVALEKKLGLKLNIESKPAGDYQQQVQVIMSSGKYPDAMEMMYGNPDKEIKEYAEDKVILPLDDLLDKHGPNIKKARPNPDVWYRPLPDGKTYAIPARYVAAGTETAYIIRKDWLDKVGLKVPGTLDELYAVARAFTLNDPDGNGKKDTYATGSGPYADARGTLFNLVAEALGTLPGQWEVVGGKLVYSTIRPETKEAIKYYRRVFQEGLVDPEYPIIKRTQWLEKLFKGAYGMDFWWMTHLDAGYSSWWQGMIEGSPQARWDFVPPLAGKDAKKQMAGSGAKGFYRNFSLLLFSKAKYPADVVRFLDYLATDEGAELAAYGIPGVHWRREGKQVVSTIKTPEERAKAGAYAYSWIFRQDNLMVTNDLVDRAIGTYAPHVVRPIPATEDRVPAEDEATGLPAVLQSAIMKMITDRNADVDREFDAMVREWLAKGGQKITDQKNEAYAKARK